MEPGAVRARLERGRPLLLDGGMATTLAERGHRALLASPLWSATVLLDDPQAVVAAHRAFLASGADVVTTVSYQLAARSLAAAGRDPAHLDALLARSVELARRAVAEHHANETHDQPGQPSAAARDDPALVAASVGAYGAVLGDGSEYRGDYGLTEADLVAFHAPRIHALVAGGADLLACETIPSGTEVAALVQALRGSGAAAWISATLGPDGRTTAEGQDLRDAFAPVTDSAEVVAIGVNCCRDDLVARALERLSPLGLPLVAYPNLGARWDPDRSRWRRRPDGPSAGRGDLVAEVARWLDAGTRLVGGCCGTGPADIRRLRTSVLAAPGPLDAPSVLDVRDDIDRRGDLP